ncbi:MAG: hypothetical protein HZA90_17830 [Verrucomicrobia bacterium]|nr:hypothetical protein [Verrucomicrobiota bacterium]
MDVRAFPDLGYEVEDWYVDGACAGWGGILEQHFAFGDRDVDIYVQFQRITNGVYVESRGWGSVTPTGNMGWLQIGWNDDVTFTATPDPHFHVEAWTVDDVVAQTGGSEFTLTDVQAVRRVKVWFAIDVYTIDASAGSCGSLTPAGAVAVPYDDNQTFTATPAAGSEVEVWWLDGQRVQTNGTTFCLFDVQTNHVLRVTFSAPVLSILATPTNTIVVSWPASAEGWVLEQANVLTSTPVPWAQIPPPYPSHDGRLCMTFTNAPPLGHHFFRLRGP